MIHGIQAFFLERVRFERRLAAMIVSVCLLSVGLHFGLAWVARSHDAERFTRRVLRWGYEGREQYVRRIELKVESGATSPHLGLHARFVPAARRGGEKPAGPDHPHAKPVITPERPHQGDAEVDRLARSRAQLMNVPLVQSEELVIERLVRPVYPPEARDRDIEGKVAVLALIDTLGAVASVEVVGGSEGGLLERAAEEAVWKCRFHPYRVDGEVKKVYAMFRFAFRIY